MRVATLGHGATCSLLVQHDGINILLDYTALPVLSSSTAHRQQQCQHEQQQSAEHEHPLAVHMLVPGYLTKKPVPFQPDAILVTSPFGLFGLPYLQQWLHDQGLGLPIHTYCTEPCIHAFQQLSQELFDTADALQQRQTQPLKPEQQQQLKGFAQSGVPSQQQHNTSLDQLTVFENQLQQLCFLKQQHNQQQQQATLAQAARPAQLPFQPFLPLTPIPAHPDPKTQPALQAAAAAHGTCSAHASQSPSVIQNQPEDHQNHRHKQQQQQQLLLPLFTKAQLQSALDAVQIVRFGERLQLPGCFGITAEARPAGCSIGSAMWCLSCGNQRFTYVSAASLNPGPSAPLHQPCLQNPDVLLLGPSSLSPDRQGLNPATDILPVAVSAAAATVIAGGKVLVPVLANGGAVLTLLEHIAAALAASGPLGASAPLLYLSPAAPDHLATSNSCCEYLEQRRQQQVLQYGQAPFAFDSLVASGRLRLITGGRDVGLNTQPAAAAASDVGRQAATTTAAAAAAGQADMELREAEAAAASGVAAAAMAAAAAAIEAAGADVGVSCGSRGGINAAGGVSSCWSSVVQEVLALDQGCVVFVPLWSMAADPGAMLAHAWFSNPQNLLLLPESGPMTARWLQQCISAQLLPDSMQWQWKVQNAPITSLACNLASSSNKHVLRSSSCCSSGLDQVVDGTLTASELLGLLLASPAATSNNLDSASSSSNSSRSDMGHRSELMVQGQHTRVLLSERDRQLLEAPLQQQHRDAVDSLQLITLPTPAAATDAGHSRGSAGADGLLFQDVELPPPLLEASLSDELANTLKLQQLCIVKHRVPNATPDAAPSASATPAPAQRDTSAQATPPASTATATGPGSGSEEARYNVSVARVRAMLTKRSGAWALEPLPRGSRPDAVAAVLQRQQQPQQALVWGDVKVAALLTDLEVAGFVAHQMTPADTAAGGQQQHKGAIMVTIDVNHGEAEIRLSDHETAIMCDSWSLRQQLLELVMKQLHCIK